MQKTNFTLREFLNNDKKLMHLLVDSITQNIFNKYFVYQIEYRVWIKRKEDMGLKKAFSWVEMGQEKHHCQKNKYTCIFPLS